MTMLSGGSSMSVMSAGRSASTHGVRVFVSVCCSARWFGGVGRVMWLVWNRVSRLSCFWL